MVAARRNSNIEAQLPGRAWQDLDEAEDSLCSRMRQDLKNAKDNLCSRKHAIERTFKFVLDLPKALEHAKPAPKAFAEFDGSVGRRFGSRPRERRRRQKRRSSPPPG